MLVEVLIYPDGKRTHEVIERVQGENCEKVHLINAGAVVDEERTGPDCDTVHETESN
jgi:hypothetical protein